MLLQNSNDEQYRRGGKNVLGLEEDKRGDASLGKKKKRFTITLETEKRRNQTSNVIVSQKKGGKADPTKGKRKKTWNRKFATGEGAYFLAGILETWSENKKRGGGMVRKKRRGKEGHRGP